MRRAPMPASAISKTSSASWARRRRQSSQGSTRRPASTMSVPARRRMSTCWACWSIGSRKARRRAISKSSSRRSRRPGLLFSVRCRCADGRPGHITRVVMSGARPASCARNNATKAAMVCAEAVTRGHMRRRRFITLLGGMVTLPLTARAQQPPRMPRVVRLAPVHVPAQVDGTRSLLRELGYVEGRNIRLEFRNAAGNVDALPSLAQQLVGDGDVDAIIAISTPAALAARKATQAIPIVAFTAVDPVGSGLADSLAHPGRNVTGVTVFSEETTVKRVELMREVVPRAVRLGTVTTKVTSGAQSLSPVLETGRKLGFAVERIDIDDRADVASALGPQILAGFDA